MNNLNSKSRVLTELTLPHFMGEESMIPFNLASLEGVPSQFMETVSKMLESIKDRCGQAFLTVHGGEYLKGETQRRGGPHTDGNYVNHIEGEPFLTYGEGGWKVGGDGVTLSKEQHDLSYNNDRGGIIMASSHSSCLGWNGLVQGIPKAGGDCSHLQLGDPFKLEADTVYYGNNQFIHESLPLDANTHRVLVRITLPKTHKYEEAG